MKMNKKLEKLCRFLIENKVSDKDLIVGFDENLVIYKDFEWDLNSKYTEIEVKDYDGEYEELLVEDCDGYKLKIGCYGDLEVETPDSDVRALLDSYNTEEFRALLEHFKFIQENADLFTRIYIDMPKIEVR
nr:MAG TPA: hypothetical protein [Caudoviricetes sp.]